MRIKATETSTAQHDRDTIDYSAASTHQKNEMINDTTTNHINCERNPRHLSKLTHNNQHIFTRPGSFNDRGKVNGIPLYSDNSIAGKDSNCRIKKRPI